MVVRFATGGKVLCFCTWRKFQKNLAGECFLHILDISTTPPCSVWRKKGVFPTWVTTVLSLTLHFFQLQKSLRGQLSTLVVQAQVRACTKIEFQASLVLCLKSKSTIFKLFVKAIMGAFGHTSAHCIWLVTHNTIAATNTRSENT